MRPVEAVVTPEGTVRWIYSDTFLPVAEALGGSQQIRRASHVEPDPLGDGWLADMAPVGGPALGPFATRQAALDAEVEWLVAHGLPFPEFV